jgi:hypothetical protein
VSGGEDLFLHALFDARHRCQDFDAQKIPPRIIFVERRSNRYRRILQCRVVLFRRILQRAMKTRRIGGGKKCLGIWTGEDEGSSGLPSFVATVPSAA